MKRWRSLTLLVIFTMVLTGCMGGGLGSSPTTGNLRGYVGIPRNIRSLIQSLELEQIDPSEVVLAAEYLDPNDYIPLSNAVVKIDGQIRGYANSSGEFYISDIQTGRRTLTIEHEFIRPLTKDVMIQRGENPIRDMYAFIGGIGHYLIIGIENYQNFSSKSDGAVKSATKMRDALYLENGLATSREITGLLDWQATYSEIEDAIWRISREAKPDDYLVVYFAGKINAKYEIPYLLPYDGSESGSNRNAISDRELENWLSYFPGSVTVILDASYAGNFADGRVTDLPWTQSLERRGYTVLAATEPGQEAIYDPALDNGKGDRVFTHFLVKGISGVYPAADDNGDGLITSSELYEYIRDAMMDQNRYDQNPYFWDENYGKTIIFRY